MQLVLRQHMICRSQVVPIDLAANWLDKQRSISFLAKMTILRVPIPNRPYMFFGIVYDPFFELCVPELVRLES